MIGPCSRCGRNPRDDIDAVSFEIVDDERDLWSCEECLTAEEEQAIDEQAMEVAAMAYCQRCRKQRVDATAEELEGWLDNDDGHICGGCSTPQERIRYAKAIEADAKGIEAALDEQRRGGPRPEDFGAD